MGWKAAAGTTYSVKAAPIDAWPMLGPLGSRFADGTAVPTTSLAAASTTKGSLAASSASVAASRSRWRPSPPWPISPGALPSRARRDREWSGRHRPSRTKRSHRRVPRSCRRSQRSRTGHRSAHGHARECDRRAGRSWKKFLPRAIHCDHCVLLAAANSALVACHLAAHIGCTVDHDGAAFRLIISGIASVSLRSYKHISSALPAVASRRSARRPARSASSEEEAGSGVIRLE